jgi:hypothetical protein
MFYVPIYFGKMLARTVGVSKIRLVQDGTSQTSLALSAVLGWVWFPLSVFPDG